jgi:hypothetical protein
MFRCCTAQFKGRQKLSRRIDLNQKLANLPTNNIPPGTIAIVAINANNAAIACIRMTALRAAIYRVATRPQERAA